MTTTPNEESQRIFRAELFAGVRFVVTGGGSGIGLTCTTELLKLGASVSICGRNGDKLENARRALVEEFGDERVFAAVCDIRESESCDAFIEKTAERFGSIDVLVNNAGGQFPSPAQHISAKGFAAVVNNNLNGTFNMTRAVATQVMIPAKSGCIINIIANIYRGFPGMVHTGAARAGVDNMTKTLAVEWAPMGIRVNAIAPGIIKSSGTVQYGEAIIEAASRACPVGRAGTTSEVAAAILFLASPAAQFITGATLNIDGAHSLAGDIWGKT